MRKAAFEMAFIVMFLLVFIFAVAQLFYVQVGTYVVQFSTQASGIFSIFRSMFGDNIFETNEAILTNSSSLTTCVIYLMALVLIIFFFLSQFLTVLGEAQAVAREDQHQERQYNPDYSEYGILSKLDVREILRCVRARAPVNQLAEDAGATAVHDSSQRTL